MHAAHEPLAPLLARLALTIFDGMALMARMDEAARREEGDVGRRMIQGRSLSAMLKQLNTTPYASHPCTSRSSGIRTCP